MANSKDKARWSKGTPFLTEHVGGPVEAICPIMQDGKVIAYAVAADTEAADIRALTLISLITS